MCPYNESSGVDGASAEVPGRLTTAEFLQQMDQLLDRPMCSERKAYLKALRACVQQDGAVHKFYARELKKLQKQLMETANE